MASSRSISYGLVLGAAIFFLTFTQISALNVEYCSSLNTAQTQANSSIYQSNGLCYNFCVDNWAFAILQVDDCYCSNEAPGITTSTSDCNLPCHGYPNDLCGSSDGLFGYLALTNSPTATVAGSSTASASSTTASQDTDTTSSTPTTTSTSPTTPITTTTSSSSSLTWTPTPVTSLETVTGQVRTVTVTPTAPPNAPSVSGVKENNGGGGGGVGVGGAVGLTVGLVALVILISLITYFCIRKRQKMRQQEGEAYNEASLRGSSAGRAGPIPSRTMSENSKYYLGTDGRQVVETWEPGSGDTPGSRKSRLMPVDPRLDPHTPLYQRGENKSRESINTIRDDHDYSRRVHQTGTILRATNPDE